MENPLGFRCSSHSLRGNIYRRLGVVFSFLRFFPMLIRVFLCPFIQGRLHQQEPGRGNASRWLWNSEFDDAPKISQNDGQVQPGSLVKHWWGRDHRGFWHAQSMQRSDLRLPRCSSNLAHTQIRLLIEATFHFSGGLPWLPWLPTLCGPLLDDNLCTLRGCENVRQQTPGGAGLKWGWGKGLALPAFEAERPDILGIPVSPALELKGGRKTLLRKAVPSRGFARRFKALSGGFGLCKSTVKKKKRHQQGPAGATSSPPKTQSLLVTTWRVLQSSYKLATDSWGLSSVIGFPAAICWQTDPMPSQTADSSSYSCAALAQTRNNVKRTDGQTVLRRLFKPFLGIILVYFTNKLQWDIPSFK